MSASRTLRPSGTIVFKKGNYQYVYATSEKIYLKDKKYNSNKRVCIGKMIDDKYMKPNSRFYEFFPDSEVEMDEIKISDAVKIGLRFAADHIMNELQLDELIDNVYGENASMIKDIALYMITSENNVMQHFESYAFEHFLYSERKFDDTSISRLLGNLDKDDHELFLKGWNKLNSSDDTVYISYDSTNMNTSSKGIDLAERGHAKIDVGLPQVNVGAGYSQTTGTPLFYEIYAGSIIDNTQCEYMVDRCMEYGLKNIGFLFDRGYFSVKNIRFLEKNGYQYLLMAKGNAKFIKAAMEEVSLRLTSNNVGYYIDSQEVYGTTTTGKIYEKGKKVYYHVYFDERRAAVERTNFLKSIERMEKQLERHLEKKTSTMDDVSSFDKYFILSYDENNYFKGYKKRLKKIQKERDGFGYFVIVSSEKKSAEEALEDYRNRDTIEKLFRTLKTELGMSVFRVHGDDALESKVLIAFIASIIRNEIYRKMKEVSKKTDNCKDYTVPAAIRELEKIFVVKNSAEKYYKNHPLNAKQKKILGGFGLSEAELNSYIRNIGQ